MQADLTLILPEIVLALYAMGALLIVVYTGQDALRPPADLADGCRPVRGRPLGRAIAGHGRSPSTG